jgi:hypothetical protein
MFSRCFNGSISDEMAGVAHPIFVRMFVPTVIVGLWTYAHLESIRHRDFAAMWKENGAVRVGNPYTAPATPRPTTPFDVQWNDDTDGDVASAADGNS